MVQDDLQAEAGRHGERGQKAEGEAEVSKPTRWSRGFEAAVRRDQVKFGLTNWCFWFKVEEGDGTICAEVRMGREGRDATFVAFTKTEQDDPPERVARHEIYHVLLCDVLEICASRGSDRHIDTKIAEHEVIERLLNAERWA
jgi:hypothetical protein